MGDDPNFFCGGMLLYVHNTFLEILGELRVVQYGQKVHTNIFMCGGKSEREFLITEFFVRKRKIDFPHIHSKKAS